jgi:3-dehydroquinate dehydratase
MGRVPSKIGDQPHRSDYIHVEGEAIGRIYQAADDGIEGLLMNPAGFLHAGYALRDCLQSFKHPIVEVHMSNIEKRGRHSVTAEARTASSRDSASGPICWVWTRFLT